MGAWERYEQADRDAKACLINASRANDDFRDYYIARADVLATLALAHATAASVRPTE